MNQDLVKRLTSEFNLPIDLVVSEIEFVLGSANEKAGRTTEASEELVMSYFYAMHSAVQNPSQTESTERFSHLSIRRWRQFADIDIELDNRMTVITGENGAGKTSLLSMIAQALGDPIQFLGTPTRDSSKRFQFRQGRRRPTGQFEQVGSVRFTSGASSRIGVRQWATDNSPYFSPEYAPPRNLQGVFIDANRAFGPYQQLESVPTHFKSVREIAEAYRTQLRGAWSLYAEDKSPGLVMKEALVAAAIYGEGNSSVEPDPKARAVWFDFQRILKSVLPPGLEFLKLRVESGEIIIGTRNGDFAMEAASGGISSLISLVWQIHLYAADNPEAFTVCFDEPENHLHPAAQRTLLPSLLEAFPAMSFIVATHSPFVATSVHNAKIYALRRNGYGDVYSSPIDLRNQALSAEEIFEEVLGVSITLPVWAEKRLDKILLDFQISPDRTSMRDLSARLEAAGLRITLPDVTGAVVEAIAERSEGRTD